MARICILVPDHWGVLKGGSEYQAHCLATHLHETTDHEVVYLCRKLPTDSTRYGYSIREIPTLISSRRFGLFVDAVPLYRSLSEIDPDLIVQRVGCAYTGLAVYFGKVRRKPTLWHVASDIDVGPNGIAWMKGIRKKIETGIMNYGVRNATCIVAQTRHQATQLHANFGRAATAVIPNFHRVPEAANHKAKKFTVVWISSLKPLKQPETFVRLAQEFAGCDDIVFKMIGKPQDSRWCNEIIQSMEKVPNLEYLGELDVDEVNTELETAHLLVNTSKYEGLPNTFLQAWMREVPTVSLNVDPDGVMEEFGFGYRVEVFEALRSRIVDLYKGREHLLQMGKRAREFAVRMYSMENADRITALIASQLEQAIARERA
jgi:glycosyltransferase involved in cell wall biosynthesis